MGPLDFPGTHTKRCKKNRDVCCCIKQIAQRDSSSRSLHFLTGQQKVVSCANTTQIMKLEEGGGNNVVCNVITNLYIELVSGFEVDVS